MPDAWDPAQYGRFRDERLRPFEDLFALIAPVPAARVVDLGCGTGEIAAMLAERLPGAHVLGLDNAEAMLAPARARASTHLAFRLGDIRDVEEWSAWDLVFSHAALQWVPDHEALFAELLGGMKPGAQIAVQMPRNEAHASHVVAAELAREEPWRGWLGGYVRQHDTLPLERYAELLHAHGFREQACLERIYGHTLASTDEVTEWVKGTLLVPYLTRLGDERGAAFVDAYRARLRERLGVRAPYFYPFRRMLFWGRKAAR